MTLDQQVCSLELAKKLKELGVKQESIFYWTQELYPGHEWYVTEPALWGCDCDAEPEAMHACDLRDIAAETVGGPGRYPPDMAYSAFTVAELGEMLPGVWMPFKDDADPRWYITWLDKTKPLGVDSERVATEADARAKMLIYLIENKLIKADQKLTNPPSK